MIKKAILSAGIFCFAIISSSCTRLFYYPSKISYYSPSAMGLKYEDVYFKSSDGTTLHGWFIPASGDAKEKGTVIQFHGNAENISSHFISLVWLVKHGYNLFSFDYRGYGKSEGDTGQTGINNDAIAALNQAVILNKRREDKTKHKMILVAYGQSIGGSILLYAINDFAKQELVDAVVVESSFPSYQDIAREKLSMHWLTWLLQPLTGILVTDRFAPKDRIKNIAPIPLLVIHGDKDRTVPQHHGKKIFSLALQPKYFWHVPGGGHITAMLSGDSVYRTRFLDFLKTLEKNR